MTFKFDIGPAIVGCLLVFARVHQAYSQGTTIGDGTFVNFDFESANVPDLPIGQANHNTPATAALPGWTVYGGNSVVNTVWHNDASLGAALVTLWGPDYGAGLILQGKYTVDLQGGVPASVQLTAGIGQTGQIPAAANSILFDALGAGFQVSFNGQTIPLAAIPGGYGGPIASFAGQTGQLLFTAEQGGFVYLDDVRFFSSPIPEPGTVSLCGLGSLMILISLRQKKR
jgi:hypothetical protein